MGLYFWGRTHNICNLKGGQLVCYYGFPPLWNHVFVGKIEQIEDDQPPRVAIVIKDFGTMIHWENHTPGKILHFHNPPTPLM